MGTTRGCSHCCERLLTLLINKVHFPPICKYTLYTLIYLGEQGVAKCLTDISVKTFSHKKTGWTLPMYLYCINCQKNSTSVSTVEEIETVFTCLSPWFVVYKKIWYVVPHIAVMVEVGHGGLEWWLQGVGIVLKQPEDYAPYQGGKEWEGVSLRLRDVAFLHSQPRQGKQNSRQQVHVYLGRRRKKKKFKTHLQKTDIKACSSKLHKNYYRFMQMKWEATLRTVTKTPRTLTVTGQCPSYEKKHSVINLGMNPPWLAESAMTLCQIIKRVYLYLKTQVFKFWFTFKHDILTIFQTNCIHMYTIIDIHYYC